MISFLPLDWLAATLSLIGVYLIGHKNKWGFVICFVCGLLWAIVAIRTEVYGLLLEVLPLSILNLWNFRKWGKNATS